MQDPIYLNVYINAHVYVGRHVYIYVHTYTHYIHACKITCLCIYVCMYICDTVNSKYGRKWAMMPNIVGNPACNGL